MAKPDPELLEQRVAKLRGFAERSPDDELAWFGLGRALLDLGRAAEAVAPLRRATACKADYSAAWRELGRALSASGDRAAAASAWRQGLVVAERTGDLQTAREIEVFLRRADRVS
jgi:predicted Zn-dependent protease